MFLIALLIVYGAYLLRISLIVMNERMEIKAVKIICETKANLGASSVKNNPFFLFSLDKPGIFGYLSE